MPSRQNASWVGASKSINTEVKYGLQRLQNISRDLAENDPLIKKYLRTLIKYVIGPEGPTIKAKSYDLVYDKKSGQLDKVYDTKANQVVEFQFGIFTKKKNCTMRRNMSFRQFLKVLVFNRAVDGEIFIRIVYDKSMPFRIRLTAY